MNRNPDPSGSRVEDPPRRAAFRWPAPEPRSSPAYQPEPVKPQSFLRSWCRTTRIPCSSSQEHPKLYSTYAISRDSRSGTATQIEADAFHQLHRRIPRFAFVFAPSRRSLPAVAGGSDVFSTVKPSDPAIFFVNSFDRAVTRHMISPVVFRMAAINCQIRRRGNQPGK